MWSCHREQSASVHDDVIHPSRRHLPCWWLEVSSEECVEEAVQLGNDDGPPRSRRGSGHPCGGRAMPGAVHSWLPLHGPARWTAEGVLQEEGHVSLALLRIRAAATVACETWPSGQPKRLS